jgi:hypothetical protein
MITVVLPHTFNFHSLDMYYVGCDNLPYQYLNKFYLTNAPGWGHFIAVKGYKQMQNSFYLEVYVPYSQGQINP